MRTLTVTQRRGDAVEAVHPVHAVLMHADGRVLARRGEPMVTTWRSAAKPFQLAASLSLLDPGLVARLSAEDLALGAASHSGEPDHVARVRALLGKLGVAEEALRCGAHPPMHARSAEALQLAGETPAPIHNNCSGKHAFMAAAAAAVGDPGGDYRQAGHPVQRRVRDQVDEATRGAVQDVVIDGCGAPCFVLSLAGMARAWAHLASHMGSTSALGAIARAMNEHPWLMSGTGRLDEALVLAARRPIVSKVGAEGLLCVALPHLEAGLALKVASGNDDARAVAAWTLLAELDPGLIEGRPPARWSVIKNAVGRSVGTRTAA